MHPADEGNDITLAIYDLDGNALSKANGTQDVTLTYTPTQAGWIAIKIWNNSTNNIAQKAWVKATYEALLLLLKQCQMLLILVQVYGQEIRVLQIGQIALTGNKEWFDIFFYCCNT